MDALWENMHGAGFLKARLKVCELQVAKPLCTHAGAMKTDDTIDTQALRMARSASAERVPAKNMNRRRRRTRGKSDGPPSRRDARDPHRALAEAALNAGQAAAQCAVGSRPAPGSTDCVPCTPGTFDDAADGDPATTCAPCPAGVTSRARATACTVLRLGPEHLAGSRGGTVHKVKFTGLTQNSQVDPAV